MKKILIFETETLLLNAIVVEIKRNYSKECKIYKTNDILIAIDEALNYDYDLIIFDDGQISNLSSTERARLMSTVSISNILIYSNLNEKMYASYYITKGFKGFIEKSASIDEFILAVNTVILGRIYLTSNYLYTLLENKKKVISNPTYLLSKREELVAKLIGSGKSDGEISRTLNINKTALIAVKRRIFSKLKVNKRIEIKNILS